VQTDRYRRESGFTLVELLISLFLLALLSASLFAALRFGSMTLNRVTIRQNNIGVLSSTEQVLNRWLESAYPKYIPPALEGMTGHVDFEGESNSMSFLTQAPQAIAAGGMARMALVAQNDGPSKALVLSARPELAWTDESDTTSETLVSGISSAVFAYWGTDDPAGQAYWHPRWNDRPTLPSLIRISVRFPNGDLRKWPDLIIAPMIFADQGCQFSIVTQSCEGR
jgi:prepilin-type N-terminal cleavage/methylation domain-containing protein